MTTAFFQSLATPFIDFVASTFRTPAMIFIVLPLSTTYRFLRFLRRVKWYLAGTTQGKITAHSQRVRDIIKSAQERKRLNDGRPMCTSRASWENLSTRIVTYKDRAKKINVSGLTHVVHFDASNLLITVEPLATVGEITDYLVPLGYMMATTLEIREATIGGLVMAVGMTTASHLMGLLQDTVEEYEIILGDGTHARVRRGDRAMEDLFHALPWSHGSLALLVGVTLRVIRVKPYVKVTYSKYSTTGGYADAIRRAADDDSSSNKCDFVEATIFSPATAVVMQGRFADREEFPHLPVNDVGWWWKEWFYKHVERCLEPNHPQHREELVPTKSYIFRHNRAVFWTTRDQLNERIGNHPFFRFLLGWMLPPQVTLLKLPAFTQKLRDEMQTQRVYQDIVLPMSQLENAVELAFRLTGISPILVYPSKIYDYGPGLRGTFPTKAVDANITSSSKKALDAGTFPRAGMFFDLGVYGIPKQVKELGERFDGIKIGREFEKFTRDVGGAPFLYAQLFMNEAEFRATFDLTLWDAVRKKYNAEGNFVGLFEKVSSDLS